MRERLSTALEIVGLSAVAVGLALVTPVAGVIFAGATLVVIGFALDRSTE